MTVGFRVWDFLAQKPGTGCYLHALEITHNPGLGVLCHYDYNIIFVAKPIHFFIGNISMDRVGSLGPKEEES